MDMSHTQTHALLYTSPIHALYTNKLMGKTR